jgi:3-keto-disaccharide hydrolase
MVRMSASKSATGMALLLFVCLIGFAQQRPQLNDGEPHGDAPFLVEDGWKPLLNGKDVSGWHAQDGGKHDWFATRAVRWERLLSPTRLLAVPEPGGRIVNGNGRTANLVTDEKHGDVKLYLEFMLAKGSNSGVYLQGLYEVQIFDSYGSDFPVKTSDGGAIYHRWINEQGVGGSAPRVNASRAPGQWQSYQIWFQAPRFDSSGKKTANAKFLRVLYNAQLVQENVDVEGGTRAHMPIEEAPLNPLMLQGDHGPVAFRNVYWRPLRPIINR